MNGIYTTNLNKFKLIAQSMTHLLPHCLSTTPVPNVSIPNSLLMKLTLSSLTFLRREENLKLLRNN